jgi:LPS-assembly protein
MRKILIFSLALGTFSALPAPASAQFDDRDTWWLCPADRDVPARPLYTEPLVPGSTEIRADTSRLEKDGTTLFAGDVEMIRDSRSIAGDLLTYEEARSLITVEGNATIWDAGLVWQGEQADFDLDSDVGVLKNGNYWMTKGRGRGHAESARIDRAENISHLEHVNYTTCPRAATTWRFTASGIRLDHDAGRGSATNALLKVHDVPVFYFPWITFPLDDRRKTGLLVPTVGSSNESGFDIRVPFYLNIAPNQDATLTPRLLDKRGVMLGGQYRYMQENYDGQLGFEYLPGDDLANGRDRSAISFRHQQFFDRRRARLSARIQNVSDAQYLEDFGRSLSVTSQRFLDRSVEMRWRRARQFRLNAIVQSYQDVDDSLARGRGGPYRRLPQVTFITAAPHHHMHLVPQLVAQTTYFDHSDRVTGGRIDLYPSVSLPYVKRFARVVPKIGVRHTEYFLDGTDAFDDRESRTVPVFSLDSRLFAERVISVFGMPMLQTLEPRAYYVYTPKVGQDDIPVFDSGEFDVAFRNLFLENRFTGRDRIGDSNRISLAATTRFIRIDDGREFFRASLGQIYFFEDREINLPGRTSNTDAVSELVGEFASNLGNGFSARAILQYDPNESQLDRSSYDLRYRPSGTGVILNASYRRQRTNADIEQTDLSFRLPLRGTLNLVGRWAYSLLDSRTLELVGGIEYESCCWGTRVVGRRFIRNTEGEYDTGIFFQFEFKGLAGYGRSTTSFLRKSIPGYESYF